MSKLQRQIATILTPPNLRYTPWQTLVNKFAGIGGDIGVERQGSDYYLHQKLGDRLYWTPKLISTTTGASAINSITQNHITTPAIFVDQNNATMVTYSGENWQHDLANAASYGGTYSRNLATVGAAVTFTTPANTVMVGSISLQQFGNMGLMKVTIDGDATRANRLPTAQQVVDSGAAPNTILIANGGPLNPTDRVFGTAYAAGYRNVIFADDLTSGVHTVSMSHTGVKVTASTDVRAYVDGFFYATNGMGLSGMTKSVLVQDLQPVTGVWEYALSLRATGEASSLFHGNTHGYDNQTALTVKMDGATITPADGQVVAGASAIEITRASAIRHTANGTTIGNSSAAYTLTPADGLTIAWAIGWLTDIVAEPQCYPAMWLLPALFDKGSSLNATEDANLAADDGTYKVRSNSNAVYEWDSDGVYGACLSITDADVATATGGLVDASGYSWIEDRADGTGINKIYYLRAGGTIQPGDTWRSTANYRIKKFADANASLAR